MKDPANAAYNCAPARFIRAVRAVAPPTSMMKMRSSLGETDFEAQQVLGYAPIEPDGSFKLNVPADTPIALAVVDSQGRALQTHTNWIQVRPGERRTCDGCHSPRRGAPINSGAIVNSRAGGHPGRDGQRAPVRRDDGRDARAPRRRPPLKPDMVSTDIWADTDQGRRHRPRRRRPALHRQRQRRPTTSSRRRRPTASSTIRSTSSRCGRATAAPTPARPATTIRPHRPERRPSAATAAWCRTTG